MLNLDYSDFGDSTGIAIGNALLQSTEKNRTENSDPNNNSMMCCSLESLSISYNKLGRNGNGPNGNRCGAIAIAKALKWNTSLKFLDLSGNPKFNGEDELFGDIIADSLQHNATLERLSVDFCNIGTKGHIAIANALKANKTLIELCMYDKNCISEDTEIAFSDTLQHENFNLQTMIFFSSQLSSSSLSSSSIVLVKGTAGCANQESMCIKAYGAENYSITNDNTRKATLIAHELGHNLGAEHTGSPRCQ